MSLILKAHVIYEELSSCKKWYIGGINQAKHDAKSNVLRKNRKNC